MPGGVGPMTIAMLLHNTTKSAERAMGRTSLAQAVSARVAEVPASHWVAAVISVATVAAGVALVVRSVHK